jgi:hypothetical protein
MSANILERVWDGAGETWSWLRGVILGEWEDNRSISQIVTDALAGFVPGLGSVITLRDLIAVVVRLARHPEKRDHIDEWILLVAMLLPLIITVAGVAAAGIGALVGAEIGGFMRAAALFVVKKGGVAFKAMVEFFQAHGYGHVVQALKQVKFAQYRSALVKGLGEQLDKLIDLIRSFEGKLRGLHAESLPRWLPGRQSVLNGIANCQRLVVQLNELRRIALQMIPRALIEMDQRLGALLAGDVKAATQVTHSVATGRQAPAVARSSPDAHTPGVGRNSGPPEPGNTRRVRERRLAQFYVRKNGQEFRFVNGKGVPVGATPFHEGRTVVQHPKLEEEAWKEKSGAVREGYPDLTAPDYRGNATTKYDTFSSLQKADLAPGDKLVRIVPHDGAPYTDTGGFWTRSLPADGREFREATAVKEDWNKDGSYVEMTVPPKGAPVWKELGQDPSNPSLKGWEGATSAQRYEYIDPATGRKVPDDFYLKGGEPQVYMDPEKMAILKKHGYVTERKPTNFKDYDPNVVNTDGTKGNIVPSGDIVFENIPLDQAAIRAAKQGGAK